MPRIGKGVHVVLRVLAVPPDLTVGTDLVGPSHIMREHREVLNSGHERTVSPVSAGFDQRFAAPVAGHPLMPRVQCTLRQPQMSS